ncbi:Flp family type IVb pilin [Arthrobacter pigmenti]
MLHLYATIQTMFLGAKERLTSEERGATAVEYGIMVALIAVVIIGVVATLGGQLSDAFTSITDELGGAVEGGGEA